MSTVVQAKLADLITLPPDELRELMFGIQEALEDMEDIAEAKRVRAEIAAGRMDTVSLDEVMQKLGITDADLHD